MKTETTQPCDAPIVWVLKSTRAGENTQLNALAEALGWDFEIKQIHHRPGIPYFLLSASLLGIDEDMSDLSAPWPDLIISAGAKNEPVCRWIRDHADKTVRLIQLGRPLANIKHFDLVVTTPQYRLPQKHNIHLNTVPMHYQMDSNRISDDIQRWSHQLNHLPKPFITLMVGGHSGPYSFDQRAVQRLVEQANQMAESVGGSLLVSSSARTPKQVINYLDQHLLARKYLHRCGTTDDNPYYAFLGLADSIIVTGDSISMLSEACAMLKPVYIYDLGEGPISMREQRNFSKECMEYFFGEGFKRFEFDHLRNLVYRIAMWKGPKRLTRDLRLVHSRLIAQQRAVWLGEELPEHLEKKPFQDVSQTVSRIKRLMLDNAVPTTSSDELQGSMLPSLLMGSD